MCVCICVCVRASELKPRVCIVLLVNCFETFCAADALLANCLRARRTQARAHTYARTHTHTRIICMCAGAGGGAAALSAAAAADTAATASSLDEEDLDDSNLGDLCVLGTCLRSR